jgi:hypothetical protein
MKRRSTANHQAAGVSVFPFLAVLLCTMGAMIIVLVVIARHVHNKEAELARAAAASPDNELNIKRNELEWRIAELKKSRDGTQKLLSDKQTELSHLEDHARRIKEQLEESAAAREHFSEMAAGDARENEELKQRLSKLRADADRTRAEIDRLNRNGSRGKGDSYAIIPYHGPNETRRRPIYIECRKDGIVLQPEGIVLGEEDFLVDLGPSNPLISALRAARDYYLKKQLAGKGDAGTPYPLLIIRPDGIEYSFVARVAISSWGSDFGYELVGQDWQFEFPPPDPMLTLSMRQAVTEAKNRQALLAQAAPLLLRAQGGGDTFRASRHGGLVQVDGAPSGMGRRSRGRAGRAGRRGGGGFGGAGDDLQPDGATGGGSFASSQQVDGDGPVHSIDGDDNPYASALESAGNSRAPGGTPAAAPMPGGRRYGGGLTGPGDSGSGNSLVAAGSGYAPGSARYGQQPGTAFGPQFGQGSGPGFGWGSGQQRGSGFGPQQGMPSGRSGPPGMGAGGNGIAGNPGGTGGAANNSMVGSQGIGGAANSSLLGSGGIGGAPNSSTVGRGGIGGAPNGLQSGGGGAGGAPNSLLAGSGGIPSASNSGQSGAGGIGGGPGGSVVASGGPGTFPGGNQLAMGGGGPTPSGSGSGSRYDGGGGIGGTQQGGTTANAAALASASGRSPGGTVAGGGNSPQGSGGQASANAVPGNLLAQGGGPGYYPGPAYPSSTAAYQGQAGAPQAATSSRYARTGYSQTATRSTQQSGNGSGNSTSADSGGQGVPTAGGSAGPSSPDGVAGAASVDDSTVISESAGPSTRYGSPGGQVDVGSSTGSKAGSGQASSQGASTGAFNQQGNSGNANTKPISQQFSNSSQSLSGGSSQSSSASSGQPSSSAGGSSSSMQSMQQSGMPSIPNLNFGQQDPQASHKNAGKNRRREKNWANPDASTTNLPIQRPIRIVCDADHLTLLPEGRGKQGMRVIQLKPDTSASVDELVDAVWDRRDSWGSPGKNMYWRPTLVMQVEPGGQRRYTELKDLLANSGFDVHAKPRPQPPVAPRSAGPRRWWGGQ